MKLILVALLVSLMNVPFGWWRSKVKKFSIQWFLAIHLPIPVIIMIRLYSDLGFELMTYPVLVISFFLGQYAGGKISYKIPKRNNISRP